MIRDVLAAIFQFLRVNNFINPRIFINKIIDYKLFLILYIPLKIRLRF